MDAGDSWELGWSRATANQAQARIDCSHPRTPAHIRLYIPSNLREVRSGCGGEGGLRGANLLAPGKRERGGGKQAWDPLAARALGALPCTRGTVAVSETKPLWLSSQKPAPTPKAPHLEETRPNPFTALALMAPSEINSPFFRTVVCARADADPLCSHPEPGVLQRVPPEEEEEG